MTRVPLGFAKGMGGRPGGSARGGEEIGGGASGDKALPASRGYTEGVLQTVHEASMSDVL